MGDNTVLMNAYYNSRGYNETQWISFPPQDLIDLKNKIHSKCRPFIKDCIEQMLLGVTFAFWFEGNKIVFEG